MGGVERGNGGRARGERGIERENGVCRRAGERDETLDRIVGFSHSPQKHRRKENNSPTVPIEAG